MYLTSIEKNEEFFDLFFTENITVYKDIQEGLIVYVSVMVKKPMVWNLPKFIFFGKPFSEDKGSCVETDGVKFDQKIISLPNENIKEILDRSFSILKNEMEKLKLYIEGIQPSWYKEIEEWCDKNGFVQTNNTRM